MRKIIIIIFFLFVTDFSYSATYYMAAENCDNNWGGTYEQPWCTFASSFSNMIGGDTLILKNGTYSGYDNTIIRSFHSPPSGTRDNFTTIKAEYVGGAIFEDTFIRLTDAGKHFQYVSFDGLTAMQDTFVAGVDWVKFKNCGFRFEHTGLNSATVFGIVNSEYVLVEDSWVWGSGRYKVSVNSYGNSGHIVFRRVVARFDRMNADDPGAVFMSYGKGSAKNGGYILPIPNEDRPKDYFIPIGSQYTWTSEDNDWISLTTQGGSIEVIKVKVLKDE